MYQVIIPFCDLEDSGSVYQCGDIYPRAGYQPGKARIAFLLSDQTTFGAPVIASVAPSGKKRTASKE